MMERTGFSADQGSVVDSLLNMTDSYEVNSPPSKYQKVAMCVVPGTGPSAGSNAVREGIEDDDNVSQVSGSTSSHVAILEATLREKKARLAVVDAMIARKALVAEIEADNVSLVKAKLESSNRSNASSRRSGRRSANDEGKRVEPIMDYACDISRDLSKLFEEEDMFVESPIRVVEEIQHKIDERASTQETASTAESAGLLMHNIVIAPTNNEAGPRPHR